jgi:hypothetical protein
MNNDEITITLNVREIRRNFHALEHIRALGMKHTVEDFDKKWHTACTLMDLIKKAEEEKENEE